MHLQIPRYAKQLLEPKRYKVLYGGRGSSKSYTVARMLLTKGIQQKIRVLCGREFQNSITESVHHLLEDQINVLKIGSEYKVTETSITGNNGTEFIFKGVRHNINSIKSMAGITDLWLEEAHSISKTSWDILIPTIREPNSEIWVTFNPDEDDDPTYQMFVEKDGSPKKLNDAIIIKVNWQDNPWFPTVLEKEKDHLYEVNPDSADNIWAGNTKKNSQAQIFRNKWVVRKFEPQEHFHGPYFGADWGFSEHPSTLVKVYIDPVEKELLVRCAKFGYGIEIDHIPRWYDTIHESRDFRILADSARPETISYVSRMGFHIEPADKWKGSVEDGIAWIKSFRRVVFHPECDEDMFTEARKYSYKVDRLTGQVLREIVDAYNHGWDGIRYACQPMITTGGRGILDAY